MANEYADYYLNQAGSGISGFSGLRYQKGNSWRGLFKFIRPVLAYFTKQGIKTAANIGTDLLGGESLKNSAKSRLMETGKTVGKRAVEKLNELSDQIGNGKKRKYTKRKKNYWSKKVIKKRKLKRKQTPKKRKRARKIYKKAIDKKDIKRKLINHLNHRLSKKKTALSGSVPYPYYSKVFKK